ncbi:fatty acid-binding protein, adipocyte-like [Styela clava]
MASSKLNGKWKLKSSDKFDEYMKELGVGLATRKMGNLAKPSLTLTVTDAAFSYKSESTFRNMTFDGKFGCETDEETADGRKVKTTLAWEGDKLMQEQKWDGKSSKIIRFVDDSGELVIDCIMNGVTCRRVYTRA